MLRNFVSSRSTILRLAHSNCQVPSKPLPLDADVVRAAFRPSLQ